MSKKEWIRQAASIFKASGSKMAESRAASLFRNEFNKSDSLCGDCCQYAQDLWAKDKKNSPKIIVDECLQNNPYGG